MQWNPSWAHLWEEPQHCASGLRDRDRDVCLQGIPARSKGARLPPSCLFWGSATARGAGLWLPMQMAWTCTWYFPASSTGAELGCCSHLCRSTPRGARVSPVKYFLYTLAEVRHNSALLMTTVVCLFMPCERLWLTDAALQMQAKQLDAPIHF